MFGKLKYLYGVMDERASGEQFNGDKEAAAKAIDVERHALRMTVAKYIDHLKTTDPKTIQRRRHE